LTTVGNLVCLVYKIQNEILIVLTAI
jgi:hypothetical protein